MAIYEFICISYNIFFKINILMGDNLILYSNELFSFKLEGIIKSLNFL